MVPTFTSSIKAVVMNEFIVSLPAYYYIYNFRCPALSYLRYYWARLFVGFDGLKLGREVVGLAVGVRVVGLDVVGFDVGVRVVGRAVDGLDVGVFVDGRAVDGLDVGAGLAVGVRVDGLAEVGLEVGRAVGRYNNKRRVCEAFQMRSGGGRV